MALSSPHDARPARLAPHALGLFLVLFALTWVVDVERAVFDADEGALLAQAYLLADTGEWGVEYPAAQLDPEGRFVSIVNSRFVDGEVIPFPLRPALVHLTAWTSEVGGVRAATVPGILGTVVAAWCIAAITAMVDRRAALLAFWFAGLASPLAFHALVLRGHGVAVGFVGLAVWGSLSATRVPAGRVLPVSAAIAGALVGGLGSTLVRRESLLLILVLGVVLVTVALRPLSLRRVAVAAIAPFGALVGTVVDQFLTATLIEVGSRSLPVASGADGFITDRLHGFGRFLVPGEQSDSTVASLLMLAAALVFFVVVVRAARGGGQDELAAGMAIATGLLVARLIVEPTPIVAGMVPAFPLGIAAIGLGIRHRRRDPLLGILAIATVVFFAATVATQYPYGGGFEWASRYLAVGLVVALPLGAVGLRVAWDQLAPGSSRNAIVVSALGIALLPVTMGFIAQHHARSTNIANHEAADDMLRVTGSPVVLSTHKEIPRTDAEQFRAGTVWMWVTPPDLPVALERFEDAELDEVPLFTRTPEVTSAVAEASGWAFTDVEFRPENPGTVALGVLTREE